MIKVYMEHELKTELKNNKENVDKIYKYVTNKILQKVVTVEFTDKKIIRQILTKVPQEKVFFEIRNHNTHIFKKLLDKGDIYINIHRLPVKKVVIHRGTINVHFEGFTYRIYLKMAQ